MEEGWDFAKLGLCFWGISDKEDLELVNLPRKKEEEDGGDELIDMASLVVSLKRGLRTIMGKTIDRKSVV